MCRPSENSPNIFEMGSFLSKFIIKAGPKASFWQLEEGTFLKAGRQTPVNPQVGNVCAVKWRVFNTVEAAQCSGGLTSVLLGASISTVEVAKYSGGLTSV